MTESERRSGGDQAKEGIKEGVRAVTGFLAALKDAIDETIREVRETNDLDGEHAKQAARSTMNRAREAMDDVRERLDFVPRKEFEALQEEITALRMRVADLEMKGSGAARGTHESTGGSTSAPGDIPIDRA